MKQINCVNSYVYHRNILLFVRFFVTVLFLVLILPFSSPAVASEKIVNVATLDQYPPYCFPKKDKKSFKEMIPPNSDSVNLQGYSWDILRESLHAMGYTIGLSVYPWKRAVYEIKSGMDDVIFPMIKTPEREKIFLFSKQSVDEANFLVYVPLDSPIKWQGLESLNGLTIGTMRGWNLGKKWDNATDIKKDQISKIIQGFKMLDMGRIDGFAGYEINFDYALKKEQWKTKYRKLPSFDSSIEYLAGVKTNDRVYQILTDFDLGKLEILRNGTYYEIIKKWGVNDPAQD